jgi:hypothetical protein
MSLYLHPTAAKSFSGEPAALRFALIGLALGTLLTGIMPEFRVAWAGRAAALLVASTR